MKELSILNFCLEDSISEVEAQNSLKFFLLTDQIIEFVPEKFFKRFYFMIYKNKLILHISEQWIVSWEKRWGKSKGSVSFLRSVCSACVTRLLFFTHTSTSAKEAKFIVKLFEIRTEWFIDSNAFAGKSCCFPFFFHSFSPNTWFLPSLWHY